MSHFGGISRFLFLNSKNCLQNFFVYYNGFNKNLKNEKGVLLWRWSILRTPFPKRDKSTMKRKPSRSSSSRRFAKRTRLSATARKFPDRSRSGLKESWSWSPKTAFAAIICWLMRLRTSAKIGLSPYMRRAPLYLWPSFCCRIYVNWRYFQRMKSAY